MNMWDVARSPILGNAIMFVTLVTAIFIGWKAAGLTKQASDLSTRLAISERRLALREVLKNSRTSDDIEAAYKDALTLFTEDTDIIIASRLYFANPQVSLDSFANQVRRTGRATRDDVKAITENFSERLDNIPIEKLPHLLQSFASISYLGETISVENDSPASSAWNYILDRIETEDPSWRTISTIAASIRDRGPAVALAVARRVLNHSTHIQLETSLSLAATASRSLVHELRDYHYHSTNITRSMAQIFAAIDLSSSFIVTPSSRLSIPELDAARQLNYELTRLLILVAGNDPDALPRRRYEELVQRFTNNRNALRSFGQTSFSMTEGRFRFREDWNWWTSRIKDIDANRARRILSVSTLVESLYPEAKRAETVRMHQLVKKMFEKHHARPAAEGLEEGETV